MSTEAPAAPSPSSASHASRRRALGLLGAGGAALVASLFGRNEARAGHGGTNVLHLGEDNTAAAPTGLTASVSDEPVFAVVNSVASNEAGALKGVHAGPEFGIGVEGVAEEAGPSGVGVAGRGGHVGVSGESSDGEAGVKGLGGAIDDAGSTSGAAAGVRGVSFASVGVYGETESPDHPAVLGESVVCVERGPCEGDSTGTGVLGRSDAGIAVHGDCPRGTAVKGVSDDGLALDVVGKARFSTAGSSVVPEGQSTAFVSNAAVTADSHITVTPVSDPGNVHVAWVERDPGSGFTVHLSDKVKNKGPALALTYLIVEPAT